MKNIVICGAGPAGCMAAISAKTHYPLSNVILIDQNEHILKKLRLSGGGRCNVSANVSVQTIIEQTPRNGRFLYASLNEFNSTQIQDFFKSRGCPLVEEDHQRLFPKSHKAIDIAQVIQNELNALNVVMLMNTYVHQIDLQNNTMITSNETLSFDHLILASGGLSYPQTGSDGYLLSEISKHVFVEKCYPAETPLVSNDAIIQSKLLQGVSLKDVSLTLLIDGKKKKQVKHDMLFTHFGFSGPGVLQLSSVCRDCFEKKQSISMIIDCLPYLNHQEVESLIKEQTLSKVLSMHQLPKRLNEAYDVLKENITPTQFLKSWTFNIHDMRGFNQAFVTSGGISVKAIDPATMRLKTYPNVSVCGEMIDVHSHTGGYNITIAMSMGYHAGKHCLD
ncbi:MAG: aminoacetone oxidase family FAD-binding enzyme [Erysipelotrichia bacterium]|nr:aminoacetone oxidase family FAD-binding enzyme [Erysipelotrichia bacterium]